MSNFINYFTYDEYRKLKAMDDMYEKAKIHVERIPDLLKQFPEALSFKADVSDPKFIYQKKKKTKRGEVENPIEVVKKVLIGIKGLLD